MNIVVLNQIYKKSLIHKRYVGVKFVADLFVTLNLEWMGAVYITFLDTGHKLSTDYLKHGNYYYIIQLLVFNHLDFT